MHDRDPLALLYDVGEDAQSRRNALVAPRAASRGVDVDRPSAVHPVDMGGVDGVLDLVIIESAGHWAQRAGMSTHVGARKVPMRLDSAAIDVKDLPVEVDEFLRRPRETEDAP